MSGQKLTRKALSILTVSICCLLTERAVGQAEQNKARFSGLNNSQERNANIQELKDAPELPQLPSYSGKLKFLRGYIQPTGKGWTVYHVSFMTPEEPLKVKDWYENALTMYQWKILNSAGQTITANHKDGHMCTLIFNPCTKPGFRTRMGLFYSLAPRLSSPQD